MELIRLFRQVVTHKMSTRNNLPCTHIYRRPCCTCKYCLGAWRCCSRRQRRPVQTHSGWQSLFFLLAPRELSSSRAALTPGLASRASSSLMVRGKLCITHFTHVSTSVEVEDESIARATLLAGTPLPHHAAIVTCLKLGSTKVELGVGNKVSATNKKPGFQKRGVLVHCSAPAKISKVEVGKCRGKALAPIANLSKKGVSIAKLQT